MHRYTCLLLLLISSVATAQKIKCIPDPSFKKDPVIQFAMNEIQSLITSKSDPSVKSVVVFLLKKDPKLKGGAFSYSLRKMNNVTQIILSGEGVTEIVHATHSFLEQIGYRFELTGIDSPSAIRIDRMKEVEKTIYPYTRWRGIRQHVNFPMDLSSYPIEEAKEYLTQLVRLKFNTIAIHSYPNLWHEVYTGDSTEYAGHFFYNRPHEIPALPIIKKHVRFNKKYFVIPSIEPFYEDRIRKSKQSVEWMRALLLHAKQIGLKIHFSIEPRRRGDLQYIIDNCKSALINYPMIDELEINTEELGGWGASCSDSTVKEVIVKWFGKETLQDTFIIHRIRKEQTDLDNLLTQIGRNIEAVKQLQHDSLFKINNIRLKIGIYCTITPYAAIAYRLVRRFLPNVEVTIMPGHGSVRTAHHFSNLHINSADLQQTTIFSWIEFDGLMFTLQNPIEGIASLYTHLDSTRDQQPIQSVLFNHWRTAENAMATRYAAETSLMGPLSKERFYANRAKTFGFTDTEKFVGAMLELEAIDKISTNELPNYGFCWLGAWINGGPYNWIDTLVLAKVKNKYENVLLTLNNHSVNSLSAFTKNEFGLVCNRVQTSIDYLSAFQTACKIRSLSKNPDGTYPDTEKDRALSIINESYQSYERYMSNHVKYMQDRGCEGTLINLWHGPVYGLKVLREKITQIPIDTPFKWTGQEDGPPLPILIDKGLEKQP